MLKLLNFSRCRDCLYSMERRIDGTPLFNDCGDNVAKSRDALFALRSRAFRALYRNFMLLLLKNSGYRSSNGGDQGGLRHR